MSKYTQAFLAIAYPCNYFAQDAVSFAIANGWIQLTGFISADLHLISASLYDEIVDRYHQFMRREQADEMWLTSDFGVPITELTSGV
jgi:hypothetical protein